MKKSITISCPICGALPELWTGEGYNFKKYPETKGKYLIYAYYCRRKGHELITMKQNYLSKEAALKAWNKIALRKN